MTLKKIERSAGLIKTLKEKLHGFTEYIQHYPCLRAYCADLPYTVIDGPEESIEPRTIQGSLHQVRDHALSVFESLDYLDDTQHEKNTARTVGIIHLQTDAAEQARIMAYCASIHQLKYSISQQIKSLSEIERRKLKRLDDLRHINFQQVCRPIHIFGHPLKSAAFTWLAHSSTVQKHKPADYIVYLERIKTGLHTAALRADKDSPLQGDIRKSVGNIDHDIAQIAQHQHRRAIYVRREVPPHPRVRLGILRPFTDSDGTTQHHLHHNVRSCPMPLITFCDERFDEYQDELPAIKPLGICPARQSRDSRRSDMVYTPILEHRNVFVRDRVRKHQASKKRRTATRLAS